ncbi:hypothetical protein ACIBSW_14325 [Actinoplanes sp. NPDC049668]|uniref:hypothetical protein n=1 Tax=unclassified Actinoplanes TaxID=2626549 RepID=UPI0033A735F6
MAAALLLAGCDSGDVYDEGGDTSSLAEGESWEELRQQARASLARYDQAQAKSPSQAPTTSLSDEDPTVTAHGMSIDSAAVNAQGTRMTVTFTGSPWPATDDGCGTDYAAEPVESDKAVVVIVLKQPNGYSGICPMMGMTRTATLNLATPLGKRAVLAIHGGPVQVSRTTNTK